MQAQDLPKEIFCLPWTEANGPGHAELVCLVGMDATAHEMAAPPQGASPLVDLQKAATALMKQNTVPPEHLTENALNMKWDTSTSDWTLAAIANLDPEACTQLKKKFGHLVPHSRSTREAKKRLDERLRSRSRHARTTNRDKHQRNKRNLVVQQVRKVVGKEAQSRLKADSEGSSEVGVSSDRGLTLGELEETDTTGNDTAGGTNPHSKNPHSKMSSSERLGGSFKGLWRSAFPGITSCGAEENVWVVNPTKEELEKCGGLLREVAVHFARNMEPLGTVACKDDGTVVAIQGGRIGVHMTDCMDDDDVSPATGWKGIASALGAKLHPTLPRQHPTLDQCVNELNTDEKSDKAPGKKRGNMRGNRAGPSQGKKLKSCNPTTTGPPTTNAATSGQHPAATQPSTSVGDAAATMPHPDNLTEWEKFFGLGGQESEVLLAKDMLAEDLITEQLHTFANLQARKLFPGGVSLADFHFLVTEADCPCQDLHTDTVEPAVQFALSFGEDVLCTETFEGCPKLETGQEVLEMWRQTWPTNPLGVGQGNLGTVLASEPNIVANLADCGCALNLVGGMAECAVGVPNLGLGSLAMVNGGVLHRGPAAPGHRVVLFFTGVPLNNPVLAEKTKKIKKDRSQPE